MKAKSDIGFLSLIVISAMIIILPPFILGDAGYHPKVYGTGWGLPKTSLTWFLFLFGFASMFSVMLIWRRHLKRNPLKVRCSECGSVADSPTSSLGLKLNFWLPGVPMECVNCRKKTWMKPVNQE